MRGYLLGMLIGFCAFLMVISAIPAQAEVTYKFGVVPQFAPRKLASIWLPILEELSKRTGLRFKMTGAPEIPKFEKSFLEGEFDFAYMNPYHAVLAAKKSGYVPLIRDGSRSLYGILVVQKNSPIQNLKDLAGKSVAFPAPNALGASLLMRADLEMLHGVKVKPLYVKTHSSVYLNVVLGQTSAGGGVLTTLKRQKPNIQKLLRIIYTTRKMPPHPITAHPRVPQHIMKSVKEAFLSMSEDKSTSKLLKNVPLRKAVSASIDEYRVLLEWGLDKFYVTTN